jgi:CYTH domain-containing protein
MGIEIERKFLVKRELLPGDLPPADEVEQGYLCTKPTVRVRIRTAPDGARSGELTIKGKGLVTRPEWNYEVPPGEAEELLELCERSLRKRRWKLGRWELDYFPERDLWLAEIELSREDEPYEPPAWLGDEVTGDPRYSNSNLASPRRAG